MKSLSHYKLTIQKITKMQQATKRYTKSRLMEAPSNPGPEREEIDSLLGLVYEKSPAWANRIRDVSQPEFKKGVETQPSQSLKNGASLRLYQQRCDVDYIRHYITLINLEVQHGHSPI
jgi:hypothetical protein